MPGTKAVSIRSRRVGIGFAAGSALVLGAALAPAVRAGAEVTCTFNSNGVLRVDMGATTGATLSRDAAGNIDVSPWTCSHPNAPAPTVTNTRQIKVFGDDGFQSVMIRLANGGFSPGLGNERGSSDEIEMSIILGANDNDNIIVIGSSGPDHVRLGTKSSGGSPLNLPIPRINLNADESTGIDDDVTHLGVEKISVLGEAGRDNLSGEGGAGTGGPSAISLFVRGDEGGDTLVGGMSNDVVEGSAGADTIKGGQGADELDASDGVAGNDASFGGTGNDECVSDAGDAETSCEI